jgi:IS1 family transposase
MGSAIDITPIHYLPGYEYELDELRDYIRRKSNPVWIAITLTRWAKQVVVFQIGRHSKRHLKSVIDTVLSTSPGEIYTDCLNT